jgi:hypothetical protein
MAMPLRERQYITNWQMSIIAAARVHDMEFIRCLRLISQAMMPNKAPPIDLVNHAKQDDYSNEDKQALVVWIKVLEDMADTGDSVLCRQFREACNEVFASQGLPDMMTNGPWVKPPPLSGGVRGPAILRERIAQIGQGLIGSPAVPSHGNKNAQGSDADPEADEGAAGRSARPEELAPDRPARLSRPIWKTMTTKRRTWPRSRGEEAPWHQRAQNVLKDVLGGPLTVEDIIDFFADHDPTPVQITLLNKFIAEEGDPVEVMTRQLRASQPSKTAFRTSPDPHGNWRFAVQASG